MHPIAALSQKPDLTLEEADQLHSQGFSVIFDGNSQTHRITLEPKQEANHHAAPLLPPAA